jgi:porin
MNLRAAPARCARSLLLAVAISVVPSIALAQTSADDWRYRASLTGDWGGLRSTARESGFTFNASYVGEAAGNLSGGDRRTALYAQQAEVETLIDMQRIAGIADARVQVTLNYRDGRSLSGEVLHNQFPVQELYSTAQILRLSQFNWLQYFADRRVVAQIGWSPLGNDFARLPIFCKFQNFGVCGHAYAMTVNSGAINGPISQWGARIKVWPTEHLYVNTGAYRNNPDGGTDGGFNLSFDHNGSYYPIEFGWVRREGALYNTIRTTNVYYDINHNPAGLTGLPFLRSSGRHGGYVMGQQAIYQPEPGNPARALSIFGIAGVGDSATARFHNFANAGVLYQGPLAKRPDDFVSLMVAWAQTNPRLSQYQRERNGKAADSAAVQPWGTAIEFDCGFQATPWLLLQPNLQYIVQSGDNYNRRNAFVLGLHFAVTL